MPSIRGPGGPTRASNSFYLTIETKDWARIGTVFEEMGAALPEMMTDPFGFDGHSDIIMRELPLD